MKVVGSWYPRNSLLGPFPNHTKTEHFSCYLIFFQRFFRCSVAPTPSCIQFKPKENDFLKILIDVNTLTTTWLLATQMMLFIVKPNGVAGDLHYILYMKPFGSFNIILNRIYFNTILKWKNVILLWRRQQNR